MAWPTAPGVMTVALLRYALPVFVPVALVLHQPLIDHTGGRLLLLGAVSLGVGRIRQRQDQRIAGLTQAVERFEQLAQHASEALVWVEHGRIAWISRSIEQLSGRSAEACLGLAVLPLVHHSQRRALWRQLQCLPLHERLLTRLQISFDPAAPPRWIELQAKKLAVPAGGEGLILAFRCVDREVADEALLRHAASHDALTGLLNRQSLLDQLKPLFDGRERRSRQLALLYLDLDGFKAINDRAGHAAGDAVLHVLASRLREQIRHDDLAARFGGDELLVCLRGVESLAQALQVCEKIRRAALQPIPWLEGSLQCSLSIGIALSRPGDTVESLIERADQAMYQAKRQGRDRVITG